MAGKGSRPRNNYSKQFRDRFEEIDWKRKHKQHKHQHKDKWSETESYAHESTLSEPC